MVKVVDGTSKYFNHDDPNNTKNNHVIEKIAVVSSYIFLSTGIVCAVGTVAIYASIPMVITLNLSPLALIGASVVSTCVAGILNAQNNIIENTSGKTSEKTFSKFYYPKEEVFKAELSASFENFKASCRENRKAILQEFSELMASSNKLPPVSIALKQNNCWAINGAIQYFMHSPLFLQKFNEELQKENREDLLPLAQLFLLYRKAQNRKNKGEDIYINSRFGSLFRGWIVDTARQKGISSNIKNNSNQEDAREAIKVIGQILNNYPLQLHCIKIMEKGQNSLPEHTDGVFDIDDQYFAIQKNTDTQGSFGELDPFIPPEKTSLIQLIREFLCQDEQRSDPQTYDEKEYHPYKTYQYFDAPLNELTISLENKQDFAIDIPYELSLDECVELMPGSAEIPDIWNGQYFGVEAENGQYHLDFILDYYGNGRGGHYVCHINVKGQWYTINNKRIKEVEKPIISNPVLLHYSQNS